jgi:hypothetical protein
MKKNLLIISGIAVLCMLSSFRLNPDGPPYYNRIEPNRDILIGDGVCRLELFQGVNIHDVSYISWRYASEVQKFYFFLLRADSTLQFSLIAIEPGYNSPLNTSLVCCFTDSTVKTRSPVYYKLFAVPFDALNTKKDTLQIREDTLLMPEIIKVMPNEPNARYSLRVPATNQNSVGEAAR